MSARARLSPMTMLALALAPAAGATPLRVRASPAFAACLEAPIAAFNGSSGARAVLHAAEPDPPRDADLVVGDDLEMTRLLEGGIAGGAFDLGYLPWVTVVPRGSSADVALAAQGERVAVLGGRAGREARASLGTVGAGRVRVTRDVAELRAARHALVPRSLAGEGEHRPSPVRPLVATAAVIAGSARAAETRRLLAFLQTGEGARLLDRCLDRTPSGAERDAARSAPPRQNGYVQSVVDWWLPQCSLDRNRYNDPAAVTGAPDAVGLGGGDFRGFMSLGQGGYVTVDMGAAAVNGPGPDVRVFQAVTGEPVTLYAASAAQGPFVLVGLRVPCGTRGGTFSNHCDFDLAPSGIASARYLKIEDGEIYPCLAGGTTSEGADIDAVQLLNASATAQRAP